MSAKSSKKQKKLSVPRAIDEIKKSYDQVAKDAGQLQYQIKVYTAQLEQLNNNMFSLNNEAAARNTLDAATPEAQPSIRPPSDEVAPSAE